MSQSPSPALSNLTVTYTLMQKCVNSTKTYSTLPSSSLLCLPYLSFLSFKCGNHNTKCQFHLKPLASQALLFLFGKNAMLTDSSFLPFWAHISASVHKWKNTTGRHAPFQIHDLISVNASIALHLKPLAETFHKLHYYMDLAVCLISIKKPPHTPIPV